MDAPVLVAHEAVPRVVFVRARIPASHPSAAVLGEERVGAGVAVGPGRVLTAHYLVLGASQVEVTGSDGHTRSVPRTTIDHESGLALLATAGAALVPARLAAEPPRPGQTVFLLTCADSKQRRGATGHITAVAPFEAFWEYMLDGALMTTLANPGLAGAPLFDARGHVVGIVSLGLTAVGRYSLAIPIELYRSRAAELEDDAPQRGRSARAWLGYYPQVHDGSVMVTGVVPAGPADRAGLERGDLLLSVDGEPVANLRELYLRQWRKSPGQTLDLQVLRGGAIQVVELKGGDRYDFYKTT